MEIYLARPLKRGFWLEDGDTKVFVTIMYERLPTFRFICGLLGYGTNNCNRCLVRLGADQTIWGWGRGGSDEGFLPNHTRSSLVTPRARPVTTLVLKDPFSQIHHPNPEDLEFGSWMLVSRWRNRGRVRGGAKASTSQVAHVTSVGRDASNRTIGYPRDDAHLTVDADPSHVE